MNFENMTDEQVAEQLHSAYHAQIKQYCGPQVDLPGWGSVEGMYRASWIRVAQEARNRFMNTKNEADKLRLQLSKLRGIHFLVVRALSVQPCRCSATVVDKCPQCGGHLEEVTNRGGMLNDEQFDSMRAGDYYCSHCVGTEAKSGYKYWWKSFLDMRVQKCARCAALEQLLTKGNDEHKS